MQREEEREEKISWGSHNICYSMKVVVSLHFKQSVSLLGLLHGQALKKIVELWFTH